MDSTLNIKQYWIRIVLSVVELFVVSVALLVLIGVVDGDPQQALLSTNILTLVLLGLMLLNGIANVVYVLLTILRRSRDTGYTVPLFLVGAFVPFGFVVVGVIPSKK